MKRDLCERVVDFSFAFFLTTAGLAVGSVMLAVVAKAWGFCA